MSRSRTEVQQVFLGNRLRCRGRVPVVTLVLVVLSMVACAPGTPEADSWRADATRAVGDVASAVQSARLALGLTRRDRVTHAYLQTVLVDSERISAKSAESLSSVQPPDVERTRSADVRDRLDRATGLLTEVRIAVVAHDTADYADLEERLRRTADELSSLEDALAHPPDEAAP